MGIAKASSQYKVVKITWVCNNYFMWDRFWLKVNKNGLISQHRPDLGPCWIWTACLNSHGYGIFKLNKKVVASHRISYELLKGQIPEKLVIDHLCRNRDCVNPEHLEPKTRKQNTNAPGSLVFLNGRNEKLKTHCPQKHEYTLYNTRIFNGSRYCKECTKIYDRKRSKLRRF